MNSLLSHLNPPQQEAVEHFTDPLLIFAGAGSGKTRVLTHRIAYLIEHYKVSPFNILALTFTNKASQEMKHRISGILGRRADEVWISTFHSLGVRLLRKEAEKIGMGNFFSIYDADDQLKLIKQALEVLQLNPKIYNPKSILGKINQAKNDLVTLEKFQSKNLDFFDEKVALVYAWYEAELKRNNAVDFGDLIMLPVLLFQKNPEVLKAYQKRFQFIMVDEYQDTNHAQYQLMKLLADQYKNLCVVGDDDQSIYRWRGADIRNILEFEQDFPTAKVIALEQNYRSTQTILGAAYEVVKKVSGRREKKIWTENAQGEKITLFEALREKSEAKFVVDEIVKIRQEGAKLSECAVFYRTNSLSRVMEDELRRQNIPYIIVGGTRFYDRMEIKDMLAYLFVIANPQSSLHIKRIINVPARGIGKTTIEKMENYAASQKISLWEALSHSDIPGLSSKTMKLLKSFVSFIEKFQVRFKSEKLSETLKELIEQSGYLQELKNESSIEADDRIENLEELVSVLSDYERSIEAPSLEAFLDQISLVSDLDSLKNETEVLSLMTLHLAKGLEYDHVFILGLEEGLFPHSRSFESVEEMDEERRLMYVGITRARKKLFLSFAESRQVYGNEQMNVSSRFLDDIPDELLDRKEEKPAWMNQDLGQKSFLQNSQVSQKDNSFKSPYYIGRRVSHSVFGTGVIRSCEGSLSDSKLTVEFKSSGTKKLVAKYANLQLL